VNCKHFGVCGGCSLPGMAYAEQLDRKRARLVALLGLDVPPLIPSPRTSAFRQKAAFVFGSGPRMRLVMGHFAVGLKGIVPVDECPVHSARANRIAFALRDRLAHAGIAAADVRGGILRHLVVRTSDDEAEAVAMLVVTGNDKSLRAPVRGLLASVDAPDGFFININTAAGPYMVGEETIKIAGASHVRENGIAGMPGARVGFLVSPDAFFQTNVGAARELVSLVLEGVGPATRVLDLYCGSGLFTLPLAIGGARVTAIEENRQAIEDLKANAKLNRIAAARVKPIAARVEDAIERVTREPCDAVVLDPPRDGCAPRVRAAVFGRIQPVRAVYVSCNPEALAAELPGILESGYGVERVQAVDMFPHTEHIETVVMLRRLAVSL
jgi:23S rRNA (uracil1939-C5)-methyltransferase